MELDRIESTARGLDDSGRPIIGAHLWFNRQTDKEEPS
jgi:hypothetical protein